MAQKDRKKWLRLFYTKWGYKPASEIRKKSEYVKKISLDEALQIDADYCAIQPPFLIQVIFPFASCFPMNKQSSDSVTIFPQIVYYKKNRIFEIEEPIFYDGCFYSLDNFISKCPALELYNAEGTFGTYVFSIPFFMLESGEVRDFSKLYLTPIKREVIKTGIYPDNRGKIKKQDPKRVERDKLIIKLYKEIVKKTGRKKPFPINNIYHKLTDYDISFVTIRRALEKAGY